MTTYAVALSKGGSTKTTTAAEIVVALVFRGRRVLAIDLDQQGNLTRRLGLTDHTVTEGVAADVMLGDATVLQAAVASPSVEGAFVLAGTHDLADLDQNPEVLTALRDYMPELMQELGVHDVVIDTPPALGIVTLAALAAADQVIASVACETEAYDQLRRLNQVIEQRIARRLRPGQHLSWIVPTRHDARRRLDREVVEQLGIDFPGKVTHPIREAVAARDAYTAGMPASIYAPGTGIALDYAAAMATILDQEN